MDRSSIGGRRSWTFWKEWVRPLLLVLVLMGSFRSAIADWNDVPTGSMRPTILEGDRIFVDRAAYDLRVPFTHCSLWRRGDPARGDVVVLTSPADGARLVKRVIGLPGDRIELRANRLHIGGRPLAYGPPRTGEGRASVRNEDLQGVHHQVRLEPFASPFAAFGPVTIPPGSYLVMGDNRDNSLDSRYFGLVPRSHIVGRATRVVLSLDPERHHLPRFRRFGTLLGADRPS